MTTLSSSTQFTVNAANPVIDTVAIQVLPLSSNALAKGRLVHPIYGTLDYPYAPDIWEGVDTDVIIPPVWASAQTLSSGVNALWAGNIKDVTVTEKWTSDISMPMAFVRTLLNFWTNPPAPEVGYVIWSPSYTNPLSYKVVLLAVGSGGDTLSLSYISRQQWLEGELTLKMRVAGRA